MTAQEALSEIQRKLHVPKGRKNNFGNYNYRNAEDILEAVKKLLPVGATVRCSDDLINIGDRYYVKATAVFSVDGNHITATGYAREADSKKGMDSSQLTGATSSYARKYAMAGLFALDDGVDADSMKSEDGDVKPSTSGEIKIGKYKGKNLTDIPSQELQNYVQYLIKANQGKDMHPSVKQFIADAKAYLVGGK